MNGVTKIGPGRYRLRYEKDGKVYSRNVPSPTKPPLTEAEARKERAKFVVDVDKGIVSDGEREPVAPFLERYVAHRVTAGKLRPKTASTYRGYVAREIAPRIGSMKIGDVRPVHVQRVLDEALESGRSPRTVVQVHAIMRGAFRWALRQRSISTNPSDGVTPPDLKAPKLTTPKAPDVARLVAAVDPNYRAALTLSAYCGLRRGEVLGLTWSAIDLDGARPGLRVKGTLQRVNGALAVLDPKTERSARFVPLPSSVVSVLRRTRTEQTERRLLCGPAWADGDYVFDRGDGRPVDPDAFGRAFRTARDAVGLENVRLHDLRHAFATMLVEAETNPRVVSDLLGHATVAFTLQTYFHPDARTAAAAIEAAEALLGPALNA